MPDNAAKQSEVDRKRNKAQEDQGIRDEIIRTLMSHPRGRRYLWLELEDAYVFRQTLMLGPSGYATTAFNEGLRTRGLKLLKDITRLAPMDYMRMTRENSGVKLTENQDATGQDDD